VLGKSIANEAYGKIFKDGRSVYFIGEQVLTNPELDSVIRIDGPTYSISFLLFVMEKFIGKRILMKREKMSEETKKLTDDILDLGKLIIVAVIMIWVIFLIIKSAVGELPAYVGSAIIGLGGIFLYATNKKIRTHFHDWLKGKDEKNKEN
jgi:hypothetical protein